MRELTQIPFRAVGLAAAGLIAAGLILAGCSKPVDKVEDVRPVRALQLNAAQQQVIADYSGNVQARIESHLGFRVSGKIQTRKVDVGTLVKPGHRLVSIITGWAETTLLRLSSKTLQKCFIAGSGSVKGAMKQA